MKLFFSLVNIDMFSREERLYFGLVFCLFIVILLILYFLVEFVYSIITDKIYFHYKYQAINEFKRCLRQIKKDHEQNYVHDLEMLYIAIKEGENKNEKDIQ